MLLTGAFVIAVGFIWRLLIINSTFIHSIINKNELVAAVTSWKRVLEGLFLQRNGISPYEGDVFHQTPIMLNIVSVIESRWPSSLAEIFVVFDVITAILIGYAAYSLSTFKLLLQEKQRPYFNKDCDPKLELTRDTFCNVGVSAMAIYLFNPYSTLACLGKSLALFENMLLAAAIISAVKGQKVFATMFVSLSAYQSFYTILLVVPVSLCLVQREVLGVVNYSSRRIIKSIAVTISLTFTWLGCLLLYSQYLVGSWAFLRSTYGFILTVPDLTPNIGIFWYFFTEMFQHFELFFLIVFQANVFIYTLPLAIKLRHHPSLLLYTQIVIISIFKSYPSYSDLGFYLSFMPCWSFVYKYFRSTFIITNMFIWCSVLSPIFFHLWIYSGSANANFYFALTLVFLTAQIFYISDLLYAYLRREFDLYNPVKTSDNNSKADDVMLQ